MPLRSSRRIHAGRRERADICAAPAGSEKIATMIKTNDAEESSSMNSATRTSEVANRIVQVRSEDAEYGIHVFLDAKPHRQASDCVSPKGTAL
jgi:hypothetical protein